MAQVVKEGKSLLPFQKRSREEVISSLKEDGFVWQGFLRLTEQLQEELLGGAMGERGVKAQKKQAFSYQDIQNVYTIVLIEKSTPEFQRLPDCYLHRSQDGFNTGLELNLPQKFIFISLDVFYKIAYTVDRTIASELVAWLLFLSSDKLEDMVRIIDCYPEFGKLYQEMAEFQRKPEELVGMYSEALAIMDRNTVQYMIEEQKKELEKLKVETEELKLETEELKLETEELKLETERRCKEKDLEIQRLRQLLNQKM